MTDAVNYGQTTYQVQAWWQGSASISGNISDGSPVQSTVILIWTASHQELARVRSDASGNYVFSGLKSGMTFDIIVLGLGSFNNGYLKGVVAG
jgi:hypothetical protein